ncbi:signal transduction histidine kinase [Saccharomonospora marina XMU15]|uniref:histidine kinase n=1 Tax=Saccharomonospora marina XMU15 TaxID=882083 RepID=H5XAL5_9PSEU|nr:histidine kinase [Saccharomonospora marina]EHR51520.1 signal transduction histidine kinase [Saccharomonospora marina XMU15]
MTTEGISIPEVSVGDPDPMARDRSRRPTGTAAPRETALRRRPAVRGLAVDALAILIAVLDVWLVIPEQAEPYSVYLSAASCVALVARRWLPFTVVLATVPGFLAGWAQLAAMIALGSLAAKKQSHWQVWVGAGLVWLCRFVLWPLPDFFDLSWREHILDTIYGIIVAGMPIAIGLLIGARTELSARLAELARSRDRERQLHAQAVRAEERARLAREMHDVVSHDITLIAMQAGALASVENNEEVRTTAATIRKLSTHTLEELRALVGVLRSGANDGPGPDLRDIETLVGGTDVPVRLTVEQVPEELPPEVSAAAYRTVQECLTNVRKHAPGATAFVTVRGAQDGLCVEVRNAAPSHPGEELPSGGGFGLAGLAERARLLGGTFETGRTEDGGFRVSARYPAVS